jgi:hypothetical protein
MLIRSARLSWASLNCSKISLDAAQYFTYDQLWRCETNGQMTCACDDDDLNDEYVACTFAADMYLPTSLRV